MLLYLGTIVFVNKYHRKAKWNKLDKTKEKRKQEELFVLRVIDGVTVCVTNEL